jgi:hypothetical protein
LKDDSPVVRARRGEKEEVTRGGKYAMAHAEGPISKVDPIEDHVLCYMRLGLGEPANLSGPKGPAKQLNVKAAVTCFCVVLD